jgi:RNA polymerase sigma-70 factor (ECF subfamily)
MHSTSASLLERLRRPDDHEAWGRFVRLYTPLLYYWLRRAGLQEHDAGDVVQDVLLHLVQKFPEFQYDCTRRFRSWLRTVTLNKPRDRRKRRAPALLGSDDRAVNGEAVPDEVALFAEDEYRRHLTAQALELMQAEFAPATWRACWAHAVEGRPAAEVAAELGLTPGAVYAARFRVLSRLRRELDGLLD